MVNTYADGYGRWHAETTDYDEAFNAIRDELIAREQKTGETDEDVHKKITDYLNRVGLVKDDLNPNELVEGE